MSLKVLHPEEVKDTCYYTWPNLTVKRTKKKGNALFASGTIAAGTAIPILGNPLTSAEYKKIENTRAASHIWPIFYCVNGRTFPVYFDGNPKLNRPYNQVGCGGLSIAMIANEPSIFMPTCIFRKDCLIVMKRLKKGQELTAFYDTVDDQTYGKIRKLYKDYNLTKNKHYNNPHLIYPDYDKLKLPQTFALERDKLTMSLLGHIAALSWLCKAKKQMKRINASRSRKKQEKLRQQELKQKKRMEWAETMAENMNAWFKANRDNAEGSCRRLRYKDINV